MKTRLALSLALLLTGAVSWNASLLAQSQAETAPAALSTAQFAEPAEQLRQLIGNIRRNDLLGALQNSTPPSQLQAARTAFEHMRVKPTSDADRAEFAEKIARLTAPNGVDEIMAELEPKLVEARAKLPGAMLVGMGALQMALASDDASLSEAERASLRALVPGLQSWAMQTDFASSLHARQALNLIADAVRASGVRSMDDLKALSFEQAIDKTEAVLQAGKQIALIYGLDINAILDSARVEVLSNDGNKAKLRTTLTVFGTPLTLEHEAQRIEGRWISSHSRGKKAARVLPAEKVSG
jgi:hypothetical protein